MACSVPCVVTAVGDAAAIVGDTGLSVPVGDAGGLARSLLTLLAMDEEGRRRLGEAARARVARYYSIEGVVGEYSRLYNHLARLGDGQVPCAV